MTWHYGSSIRGDLSSGRGNKFLKRALFLSAFTALKDPLSRAYHHIGVQGSKHSQALIALAGRRCDVLFAMLRDGRLTSARSRSLESAGSYHRLFSDDCTVHHVLPIASRLDVMHRLGRAMADPTRSRILLTLLDGPAYPAELARDLELTRSNVSNHLACLRDCGIAVALPEGRQTRYELADLHLARALSTVVEVTLAVDTNAPCLDPTCTVPGCDNAEVDS